MITGISGGQYVYVSNTTGGVRYSNNINPLSGTIRYNQYGQTEIFDGHSWIPHNFNPTVALSPDACEAISWALKKMLEEKELEQKAKNNPAVKAAIDNLRRAEEQLKTTLILSKE